MSFQQDPDVTQTSCAAGPAADPHPPPLLHLLDVLDANSAAAARAEWSGLLPGGALPGYDQGLEVGGGQADTQSVPGSSHGPSTV